VTEENSQTVQGDDWRPYAEDQGRSDSPAAAPDGDLPWIGRRCREQIPSAVRGLQGQLAFDLDAGRETIRCETLPHLFAGEQHHRRIGRETKLSQENLAEKSSVVVDRNWPWSACPGHERRHRTDVGRWLELATKPAPACRACQQTLISGHGPVMRAPLEAVGIRPLDWGKPPSLEQKEEMRAPLSIYHPRAQVANSSSARLAASGRASLALWALAASSSEPAGPADLPNH
jgi:hypothetical protein